MDKRTADFSLRLVDQTRPGLIPGSLDDRVLQRARRASAVLSCIFGADPHALGLVARFVRMAPRPSPGPRLSRSVDAVLGRLESSNSDIAQKRHAPPSIRCAAVTASGAGDVQQASINAAPPKLEMDWMASFLAIPRLSPIPQPPHSSTSWLKGN